MASKEGWTLPDNVENYLYEHTRTSLSDKQFSQQIKTPSDADIGRGVKSGDIPAKEAFVRSMAKNQAELAAAGKPTAVRQMAANLQEAQLRGRVEAVTTVQENIAAGLEGKQLYKGVNDAIRAGEQSYFDSLNKPSSSNVGPASEPSVIVDSSLLDEAQSKAPKRTASATGTGMKVFGAAGLVGAAGTAAAELYEGKTLDAGVTVTVTAAATVAMKKVPALVPIAVMASTIAAYDENVERHAFAIGDWVENKTGMPILAGAASATAATGESLFNGTFGAVGKGLGEGAAAAYLWLTD
jgi:hypothetical protein